MLYNSPRRLATGLGFLLLAAGLLLASFAVARPAHAYNYSAGNFEDLSDAINSANSNAGDDTISLTADIVLTDTLPQITTTITIEGNGHTISGNNQFYIFDVEGDLYCPCGNGFLTLNNATLANGYGADEVSNGSAIFNLGGAVNVNNVTFLNNTSSSVDDYSLGGAICNIAGILNINNSAFLNNQSISTSSSEEGVGGAIYNTGPLTINNTTFTNNLAFTSGNQPTDRRSSGGAIHNEPFLPGQNPNSNSLHGKGVHPQTAPTPNIPIVASVVTITNSTFNNNQAVSSDPNGLNNNAQGGAILNGSIMSITNSTFSDNTANAAGGSTSNSSIGGAISNVSVLSFTNTTFSNNNTLASGASPSIHGRNLATAPITTLEMTNTILAVPAGQDSNCELLFGLPVGTNNLQYPDTSCGATIPVANPLLDSGLKNNGGPTRTIALKAGSPAINTADPAACPTTDQRGFARVGTCDIGAFEFTGVAIKNGAPPPADLVGQLRITPDRLATTDSQNLIGYIFTVKNIGQGEASAVSFELPVDPNLVVGYTEFNDPETWVSSVTTTSVSISLPNLTNGEVVSGTIFFRPNTAPAPTAGTEVTSRYNLKFTNPDGSDKMVWSNAASTEFGGSNTDVSQGMVQLMMADAPDGGKITYHSHFWIPNETVTAWITWPDGVTSKELKVGPADADGHFMVEVDAAALGLEPGSYVIAAHGARSEIYGSGVLVVSASGSSSAKPATGLGLKSLGAKALVAPESR